MVHPGARELALQLIKVCDVVVENFRPGMLESWGLGWEVMKKCNPGLVYLSMSGFGQVGPNAAYVVFAPVMQTLSGLHAMAAKPGREPAGLGFSYCDHVAGYFGALAVLAALEEHDATGRGTMIDLSQVEASIALTSTAILDFQVNQRPFVGWGNVPYGSGDCPAGLYRCSGADAWCAITVRNETEWQALTETIGDVHLADDSRLVTSRGRIMHRDLVDHRLELWTKERSRDLVVETLTGAGVACTPMLSPAELLDDARLNERGYFEKATHPLLNERVYQMGAIKSANGPVLRSSGPLLGEGNDYVYGELLGLSQDEISAYRDDAVI
jgi:crotonobetainyl-CoA:carnitine CoA-transferase CaiB-like acyl-CoA transferase